MQQVLFIWLTKLKKATATELQPRHFQGNIFGDPKQIRVEWQNIISKQWEWKAPNSFLAKFSAEKRCCTDLQFKGNGGKKKKSFRSQILNFSAQQTLKTQAPSVTAPENTAPRWLWAQLETSDLFLLLQLFGSFPKPAGLLEVGEQRVQQKASKGIYNTFGQCWSQWENHSS